MVTMFLANVIAWYFIIMGLLLLIRTDRVRDAMEQIMTQPGLFFVVGLFTLILGLLMVISHNLWVTGWPAIITLFSWLVLISGIIRLFAPELAVRMSHSFLNNPGYLKIAGIFSLIIGFILLLNIYALYYGMFAY